jgi:hypothetical protein
MKYVFAILLTGNILFSPAFAQESLPPVDKSPLDVTYYPVNYPVLKIQNKVNEPLLARVVYSRPRKESRAIFGGLVEYGKLWRLGANEATEIEFYKNVTINGKKVLKGRYTLYAIVNENNWVFIINRETDTWGSFKYDASKDVVRVEVPVRKLDEPVESLAMSFSKDNGRVNLWVAWENVKAALPIYP